MEFLVHNYRHEWPEPDSYPAVLLTTDQWDDYGYSTLFHVAIQWAKSGPRLELGSVKILKAGQGVGPPTILPGERFSKLGDEYCSLGQDLSYYELLVDGSFRAIRDEYLSRMQDVVFNPTIRERFQSEEGFRISLLRSGSAERALTDGQNLLVGAETAVALQVRFTTSVGGNEFTLPLRFGEESDLPSHINAVIGYNGAGKTHLLANLAQVAVAEDAIRERRAFRSEYGSFNADSPKFAAVVTVSYSAFDTFELPKSRGADLDTGEFFGHVYCGLRKTRRDSLNTKGTPGESDGVDELRADSDGEQRWALKSIEDITSEFAQALRVAKQRERRERFQACIDDLYLEPSFAVTNLDGLPDKSEAQVRALFAELSTGHKVVLNILAQLNAYLHPNSLVLIDEPEAHLHPPLLAAFLRCLIETLRAYKSYAVIATHSPVVLQEIPRRYVSIIQRFGSRTEIVSPAIETFGENVGVLTSHVFSLDASNTDYHAVLHRLAVEHPLDEVLGLFDGELSGQALAYLMSFYKEVD